MKKTIYASLMAAVVCSFMTCGNSSKSNSYENTSLGEYSSSESEEVGYGEQEAQMVTCPMCNGTGIFDFMLGDMMAPKQTCGACKR